MISYSDFVFHLKKIETPRIKMLFLPESCATFSLPEAFKNLLFSVIDLLSRNVDRLCQPDHMLCLFSIQSVSANIQSSLPQQFNRVYYANAENTHFCCVLQYLIKPIGKLSFETHPLSHQVNWQQAHSVIVDFTSGEIFDNQHYLFSVLKKGQAGHIYGQLPTKQLKQAWLNYQLAFKN